MLRTVATSAHRLLRLGWYLRRPRSLGAHALALTDKREIVLVKLRYVEGWRVPGGGRKPGEDPLEAVLRELREEIGLQSHGATRFAGETSEEVFHKRDTSTLHIVEDVVFRPPRWSLEVEEVRAFALDDLPPDLHGTARRWIAELQAEG